MKNEKKSNFIKHQDQSGTSSFIRCLTAISYLKEVQNQRRIKLALNKFTRKYVSDVSWLVLPVILFVSPASANMFLFSDTVISSVTKATAKP